jgi:putative phosphoesterase
MKIGVLSDTHGYVSPKLFEFFKDCNQIWHAGDIGDSQVIDELQLIAPVVAVYGNCDAWDVRTVTSEYRIFDCESHKVAIMHIGGYPRHYSDLAKKTITEEHPTILVAGHSHILKVQYDTPNNLLFINPGAAGKSGFHRSITFLRFDINKDKITDLEVFDQPRDLL